MNEYGVYDEILSIDFVSFIYLSIYFYVVIDNTMKIFSAFDTQFKYKSVIEQKQKYGDDKVHLLEKSNFFFLENIIIPFITIIFITLIG
jgi:hypothetical protein